MKIMSIFLQHRLFIKQEIISLRQEIQREKKETLRKNIELNPIPITQQIQTREYYA